MENVPKLVRAGAGSGVNKLLFACWKMDRHRLKRLYGEIGYRNTLTRADAREVRMKVLLASVVLVCLCGLAFAEPSYTVLYNFGSFPGDGVSPAGGLVSDAAGNLYGITIGGGAYCQDIGGCGTAYELSPSGGGMETVLYSFCTTGNQLTCPDGSVPDAGLMMDKSGNLYGTTDSGGTGGAGVVFRLSPPQGGSGNWSESVLWNFSENSKKNGFRPGFGKLNVDIGGNLYGTTQSGGASNKGIVYQLAAGGGTYTFSILHSFSGPDGADPQYGVGIDNVGNLYGTTDEGGKSNTNCAGQCGLVYELTLSSGTWKERVLYEFNGGNGGNPVSPISIDTAGNLYGTLVTGGIGSCAFGGCGGVFKLVPKTGGSGNAYTFLFNGQNGGAPMGGVLVPLGGVVYGTTTNLGGNVFSLRGKSETVLYTFCSLPGCADGAKPATGTLIEHGGALYGATFSGGLNNSGVVYVVTP